MTAQISEVHLSEIPQKVDLPVKVTINGHDFVHEITQTDLDSADPIGAVLVALEALVDTSADVTASVSAGHLEIVGVSLDTPFTASLTMPNGLDVLVTGGNGSPFSASCQVKNIEVESYSIPAQIVADVGKAQVTRIELNSDLGPDTVGEVYTVTIGSTEFGHTVTQSDLDSVDPMGSVLGSIETLIEADTNLGVAVDKVASGDVEYRVDETNSATPLSSTTGLLVADQDVTFTSPNQLCTNWRQKICHVHRLRWHDL